LKVTIPSHYPRCTIWRLPRRIYTSFVFKERLIHINPHISICQAERQIGIPRATTHRLLQSVRYHPYHITLVQELSADDYRMRAQFCTWALILEQNPELFWNVLFGDEATFHSNGCLNKHNCHY